MVVSSKVISWIGLWALNWLVSWCNAYVLDISLALMQLLCCRRSIPVAMQPVDGAQGRTLIGSWELGAMSRNALW